MIELTRRIPPSFKVGIIGVNIYIIPGNGVISRFVTFNILFPLITKRIQREQEIFENTNAIIVGVFCSQSDRL